MCILHVGTLVIFVPRSPTRLPLTRGLLLTMFSCFRHLLMYSKSFFFPYYLIWEMYLRGIARSIIRDKTILLVDDRFY